MAKLPCPPELWPEFSALLDVALDLPEGDRPRWLASLGAEHDRVRPWLAKVMATTGGTLDTHFMQGPVLTEPPVSEFNEGQPIGPYVLIHRLGSGGMGEVWLATRSDGVLNRQVALKLPHRHLLAGVLRRRFERERDILAGLSHPHIAQLYDAGVAEEQYPYLAMEWIDGVSINDHCRNAKLPLERRLDLFLQILDAVGYAHGRLIAHRDLKPSNILVTRDERVKLLDFGIAKLLTTETEPGTTQLTRVGSFIATPSYAAPEQMAGEPITAAVDLYALGVVLHELLTGERPLRRGSKTIGHMTDTARASSRIDALHAPFVGGLETKQLRRALSGDLDAIVAKALEADPARRYRSAEVFALDIRRSREHRPISARRISPTTLTLKFVRRHVAGVAMSATLLLVLIGGSAGIAWQAVRAEREAQRATTIKDFLIGVFRASDPRIAADKPRGEITARELLDISAKQIENGFAKQPETKIELLGVTAEIYRELDETQRSTTLYARESQLANQYYGSADTHVVDGLLGQAYNADFDGDDSRALLLLSQADPLIHKAHLDQTAVRARWLTMRGEALMGDPANAGKAQEALESAVALFKKAAPLDPRYHDALSDLGNLSLEQSQFAVAAQYYRHAIAVADPNAQGGLLWPNAGLALTLASLGDFPGAAGAFEEGSRIAARTYGPDSPSYWAISSDWAQFRYERGERQEALAAFEMLAKTLPGDQNDFHNATGAVEAAQVLRKFGRCLADDGQGARAVQLLERAQTLFLKSASHAIDASHLQLDLGKAYAAGGRINEARDAFSAALNLMHSQNAPPLQQATARERWGRFLLSQNDLKGAVVAFQEAGRLAAGRPNEPQLYALAGLAAVAVIHGDVNTAIAESGRAMDDLDHIEGYYNVRIQPYVWGIRARALRLSGDYAGARVLAKRKQEKAHLYYAPDSVPFAEADYLVQELTNNPVRNSPD